MRTKRSIHPAYILNFSIFCHVTTTNLNVFHDNTTVHDLEVGENITNKNLKTVPYVFTLFTDKHLRKKPSVTNSLQK